MSEKKKFQFLKTFKGQILVFMLLWSSCQTMSYYLVTGNFRKAKKIREHYVNRQVVVAGINHQKFTFSDGETVYVKYNSEEKRAPAIFFTYETINNLSGAYQTHNNYIKERDFSFDIDSIAIGYSFYIVYSQIDPVLFMDEEQYISSLSEDHVNKIHNGLKSLALVWLIILAILWLIMWVLYKINNEEILMTPEKDLRTLKVKFGLAQKPNEWDDSL